MKKNLILAVLSAVMMLTPSCQKTASNNIKEHGYLAFGDFSLDLDEEVITKGAPADGGYTIFIYKRVEFFSRYSSERIYGDVLAIYGDCRWLYAPFLGVIFER